MLHEITEALTSLIGDHGVYAVFFLMLIDAVLPAASELVMVYAGAVAAGAFAGQDVVLFGHKIESEPWAYVTMALAGGVGYIIGSMMGWAIGRYAGRPYLERHGRWLHVTPHTLDRTDSWFQRYGDWAVALGRVTPVVRSFIAIPSGIAEVPFGRYTLLTIPGSLLWAFAFAAIGWVAGSSWEEFHHGFRYAEYVVAGAIVAVIVAAVWRHRRGTKMGGSAEDPAR